MDEKLIEIQESAERLHSMKAKWKREVVVAINQCHSLDADVCDCFSLLCEGGTDQQTSS